MNRIPSLPAAIAFAAITLTIAACDDDSGPASFSDPIDAQEALMSTWCETGHACRDTYPAELAAFIPFELMFGADVAECRTRTTPSDQEVAAVRAAIAAGRTHYHADRAESCHTAVQELTCDTLWAESSMPNTCDDIFVGTLANGQSCAVDVECISQSCEDDVCVEDD